MACSPPATSPTASIVRQSPRQAQDAWQQSTPNAGWKQRASKHSSPLPPGELCVTRLEFLPLSRRERIEGEGHYSARDSFARDLRFSFLRFAIKKRACPELDEG